MTSENNSTENISFVDYNYKIYYKQINEFDCGDTQINKYLKEAGRHSCLTKLVLINDKITAFISYNCSSIGQIIKDDDGFQTESKPAVEIKVYGVHKDFQHDKYFIGETRFSSKIFQTFLMFLKGIANTVMYADYFIVFSIPRNKQFLMANGFEELPNDFSSYPSKFADGCIPMFAKIPK